MPGSLELGKNLETIYLTNFLEHLFRKKLRSFYLTNFLEHLFRKKNKNKKLDNAPMGCYNNSKIKKKKNNSKKSLTFHQINIMLWSQGRATGRHPKKFL